MARPHRHPKTGIFWLRWAVPEHLRQFVGKREEKLSLGTRDPEEARRLHAQAMVEIEARWANLRAGERALTEREAHELAKPLSAKFLALYQDDPSHQPWHPDLYDKLVLTNAYDPADDDEIEDGLGEQIRGRSLDAILIEGMRIFAHAQAQYLLEGYGLRVDVYSHLKLVRACAIALQRASVILAHAAETGEPIEVDEEALSLERTGVRLPSPPPNRQPVRSVGPRVPQREADTTGSAVCLSGLLEGWWSEAKAAGMKPSAYESYSNTLATFVAFLGHDDARRVSGDDVVAFKVHRLATPSPRTGRVPTVKTVKDGDLVALKTVFRWAVTNRELAVSPASGITIKMPKPQQLRSKGFTDDEAKAILSAALHRAPGREALKMYAAKQWVPWLCAFTGARVGEMAQLRKQDVTYREGHWILRITPEAGTVKTNQAREVVLHPQVVELGFPAFVEGASSGHLFLTPKDGDVLKPLKILRNRLVEFGRKIVSDKGVNPNHGWRHRFKTIGMEVGIAPRILDAIQGQAPRTVADNYGDVTLKTKTDAILKIPRYDIS